MNYLLKKLLLTLLLPLGLFANSYSSAKHQDFYIAKENSNDYEIFSFTVDKNKFLTVQDDGHLLLWDLNRGLPIKDFGDFGFVYPVKKSRDNRYMLIHSVSNDYNDSLKFLDTKTEEIFTIASKSQVEGSSYRTDLSKDGKYFIFTEGDCNQNIIKVWDIEKKKLIKTFHTHTTDLFYIKISPKNNFILTIARKGYLNLWSMQGKKIFKFKLDKERGNYPQISSDEKYLLIGKKLFDVEKRKIIKTFKANKIYFTANKNEIIYRDKDDNNITFWDINRSKVSTNLIDKEGKIYHIKQLENRRYFEYSVDISLTNQYIRKIKIFDTKEHKVFRDINNSIKQYAFLDTKDFMVFSDEKKFHLFDLKKNKNIKSFNIEKSVNISSALISQDGKYIASVIENTIVMWDVEKDKLLYRIVEKNGLEFPLVFNSTGEYFIIFSDNSLKIFDTKKGSLLKTIKISNKEFHSYDKLYLTSNDKYLFLIDDRETKIWNFEKNELIKSDFMMDEYSNKMFTQKDKYVITIVDNRIKLYDMDNMEFAMKEFILGNNGSWVVLDYKNHTVNKETNGNFIFKKIFISPLLKYELKLI